MRLQAGDTSSTIRWLPGQGKTEYRWPKSDVDFADMADLRERLPSALELQIVAAC